MSRRATQQKRATYPAYKPSDVAWLGNVPQHWDVDRAKWTVTDCRNGIWAEQPDGINDLPCVRVVDFDRTAFRVRIDDPTVRAVTPNERRGRLLQNGDLLLEKSGGGDLQPVGAVMQYDHDVEAVCANFIARMPVADGYASRFLAYLHAHLNAGRVNTRSIKQTTGIQNIDSHQYLNELVVHPPLDEQKAIAAFLDRETARIDALIEKKQRQIELLQEKRSALISHTVTKGLDPKAKMKDSGIEWLGEIPSIWSIEPAKRHFVIQRGKMPQNGSTCDTDRMVPYFKARHVLWGTVDVNDLPEMWASPSEIKQYGVESGDLLVCEGGEVGRAGIAFDPPVDSIIYQHTFRVRAKSTGDVRFLMYVLHSVSSRGWFDVLCNRVTIANFPGEKFAALRIPLPTADEQRAIAAFLDRETARIDALIEKKRRQIELLQEKRSALISAAVTGKIDVRKEVP